MGDDDRKACKQVPGSTTCTPVNTKLRDIQFYFLVTGRTENNGFAGFADNLVVEILGKLIKGKAPGVARFIHFDCWNNKVGVVDFTPTKLRSPTRPKWIPVTDFKPTEGDTSQDPKTFVDINAHTFSTTLQNQFSITNVYHSIRGAPAGSVVAVMFISHGFADGPVLANTGISPSGKPLVTLQSIDGKDVKAWSSFPNNLPKRWDEDADGRMDGDFADNMGEDPTVSGSGLAVDGTTKLKDGGKDALTQFKAAFNKTTVPGLSFAAQIGLLGCDVQEIVYDGNTRLMLKSTVVEALAAIMWEWNEKGYYDRSKIGGKINSRSITDTQDLKFDLHEQFHDEAKDEEHYSVQDVKEIRRLHFSAHADLFGASPPSGTQVQTTWGDVVKFAAGQAMRTYAFKAAKVLEVEVLATPPGTSGEIEKEKAPNKMVACSKNIRCTAITKFFNDYVGLPASQDGYSLFDVTSVASIEQHAAP